MGAKKTALVVDDDEEICKMLEEYFVSENLFFYTAHSIESALKIADQHAIDVVILDDNLKEGTKGVYHIPAFQKANKNCKVYMLTANSKPDLKQKAALLGASGFLVKPLDLSTLDKALNPGLFGKGTWQ